VSKIRVLVIGCGKMGSAILDGVLRKNLIKKESLFIVEPNIQQKTSLEKKGIKVFNNLSEVNLSKLRINSILLAVKPQIAETVLTNLNKIMINNVFIISIVAGKKINFYKKILGSNTSIIRAMPNTPASCGKGVTAIYPCRKTNSNNINIAKSLFSSVGTVII
jgi:pyrroline-5-carboxylate reductase